MVGKGWGQGLGTGKEGHCKTVGTSRQEGMHGAEGKAGMVGNVCGAACPRQWECKEKGQGEAKMRHAQKNQSPVLP